MRLGELLALTIGDIDFDKNMTLILQNLIKELVKGMLSQIQRLQIVKGLYLFLNF